MKHAAAIALLPLASLAGITAARSAQAQEPAPQTGVGRGSVKIFDSKYSTYGFEAAAGPIWSHTVHEHDFDHHGLDVYLGRSIESAASPFFITGHTGFDFRALDAKSFALTLVDNGATAGVVLGPLDLHTRVMVAIFTVDIMHAEPSFEMLSPKVGAGVGIHLGKLRVDVDGTSEFLWRWFGPSYYVRSISFAVRFDMPPPKSPMTEEGSQLRGGS